MRFSNLLVLLALSLTPTPTLAGAVTQYEPWKMGRPGGYREKVKAPNRWFVRGDSTSSTIPNFAIAMVLHRMAIRAKASNFSHFSIVNFEINNRQFCRGCNYGNQDVYLTAVGVNDPTIPAPCEAKPKWAGNCETLSVSETLTKYGAALGRTLAMQDEEILLLQFSSTAPRK